MKYIKNGKVVLDGTIKECDLEEKLLKALEIIVDKRVNLLEISTSANYETYREFFNKWNWYGEYDEFVITEKEYELLKEILWN